jgi:transcriptional repressor NrdR
MVMDRLRAIDRVAYMRFASVYRDFADIESFKQEVEALQDALEREVPSPQLPLIPEDPPARRRRGRRPRATPGMPMDLGGEPPPTS